MGIKFKLFRNNRLISLLKDSTDTDANKDVLAINYNESSNSKINFYKLKDNLNENSDITNENNYVKRTSISINTVAPKNGTGNSESSQLAYLSNNSQSITEKINTMMLNNTRGNGNNYNEDNYNKFHNYINNLRGTNLNAFSYLNSNRNNYKNMTQDF